LFPSITIRDNRSSITAHQGQGHISGFITNLIQEVIMNERLKGVFKSFLQPLADALIASSKKLPDRILQSAHRSVYLSDIFYPYKADQVSYILPKPNGQIREGAHFPLPTPPQDLWVGYGTTIDSFLNSGKIHVATMHRILEASGFCIKEGNRVLDFGCASGRMIRWLNDFAERCEIWGVDITATHIIWCQQHLSPPFNFLTVTTAPHLPFEDCYFDLIYAGSVFTHIDDLADAWLLELKRTLKPGGRLYITVQDKHAADLIMNHPEKVYDTGDRFPTDYYLRNLLLSFYKEELIGKEDFAMFTINRGAYSQVFYDIDYLHRHWGRTMNILSVTQEAYGFQTAIVLGK
jgi:ubiquinone/menaquinone biosynthesis C-methylase UbiE